MQRAKTKTCPECGSAMRFGRFDDSVEYKGVRREITSKGWHCPSCGEAILEAEALAASERAFIELRAEVDGVLLPEEVAEVRARLKLSQREAGRLLGGGPRAFQKYESGQVPVSVPMKNLLLLLRNDPKRLKELTGKAAKGKHSAATSRDEPEGRSRRAGQRDS